MNTEERDRTEWWLRRMDDLEEGLAKYPPGGAVPYFAKRYPIPDTSGLTAEQAEVVLAKWRAEVNAAMTYTGSPPAAPVGVVPAAPHPTPTEAPVT